MKMKHFVLGFIFNSNKTSILLVKKERPEWQKGYYNGIGGKIKLNESPSEAMIREGIEETSYSRIWEHVLTFICPGGTVFVFRTIDIDAIISYKQVEDEELIEYGLGILPDKMMANLKWMIPVCLSNLQFPLTLQQNTLGVK